MDKRKFLFVSLSGLIGDIAWQVLKEGHDVRYYIEAEKERDIADGFVPKSKDWERDTKWADIVVFDDTLGQGAKAKALRDAGKPVIGGSEYTDRLEDDRSFGQEELKKAGVNIIPYQDFESFDPAIEFVMKNPDRYVIKPSGEAQNVKRRLFVGEEEDGDDVVRMLEAYKRAFSDEIKVFQLQRRVTGVEVAVGAFFNGKKFIFPVNINFEHKKLFPGNIGPPTGEMGTSMFWAEPNRLFNQTLLKMEPKLAEEGYVGYIDLNCIVNNNGIYPLEFTSRFGYPTISIQQEGMLTPMSDLFWELATGAEPKWRTRSGFQLGVRIVVPPFPFDDEPTFESFSKNGAIVFKKPNYDGVHIEDVKEVKGQWLIAGTSGVVLIVCGTGQTMLQAKAQAYSRIKNIMIANMYYRTDIGDRWVE
ncbi:MAG: phosphoribosylglycinamide synthetase C domain-containing protein, partial [Candidatus Acidiferrum sp.]